MIYICGDSFCVSDPEYGVCWTDILADRFSVQNLAEVAATNLLIAQQVDRAIAESAEFVIVQGTAVTRSEKRVGTRLVPFSYHTASKTTTPFTDNQLRVLKEYYTEFFDLDQAIYQNSITIEHTLNKLVRSGIPFRFDQGGFEHPKFGSVKTNYFADFAQYRSAVNLWSYVVEQHYRPYYHITDTMVHQQVADYYTQEINKHL